MEKVFGAGWLRDLFRSKPVENSSRTVRAKSDAHASRYHAVSILPCEQACAAAYRLTGYRFLSGQAPKLPLLTCDAFNCTCRYQHHADRRTAPRRRSDFGLLPSQYPGTDRRRSNGRRSTDT
jgi:hypothetical protein